MEARRWILQLLALVYLAAAARASAAFREGVALEAGASLLAVSPPILLFEDVLSAEECAHVRATAGPTLQASHTLGGQGACKCASRGAAAECLLCRRR